MAVCPACAQGELESFHRQEGIPSHSCLLMDSAEEALRFPQGTIDLGVCPSCGFIANAAVDESLQAYAANYEETQGFSPRFREFADELARDLVERHDIHGRQVLEIGCGKGEFLAALCEIGDNRGVGIDPAIAPGRLAPETAARIEWIADYWSERYAHLTGDVVVCRHTLEHIPRTRDFLRLLRRTLGERRDTLVFFELPEAGRVLREIAFWDVYYEHCSYYTPGALARQFRACGFEVERLELAFDDQYILLEARPADVPDAGAPLPGEEPVDTVVREAHAFREGFEAQRARWRDEVERVRAAGGRTVLWGSGSKGVSFLTTLGLGDQVEAVVDINPHKHGKRMAGTGHEIVAPEALREIDPDLVIAMNPIYLDEIGGDLARLGVETRLLAV